MKATEIIVADTIYRLSNMLKTQFDKSAKLTPNELYKGVCTITEFDRYFVEAPIDTETGEIEWPQNESRKALPTPAYDNFVQNTAAILQLPDLAEMQIQPVLSKMYRERSNDKEHIGEYCVPTENGEGLEFFIPEIAGKVLFYGRRLIGVLRANGASKDFAPASAMLISDFSNLRDTDIVERSDAMDDPIEVDHPEDNKVRTFGELLKARTNTYELSTEELAEAAPLKEAYDAWYDIYLQMDESKHVLADAIADARERAQEYLDQRNKTSLFA